MIRTAIRHSAIRTDRTKVEELCEIARRWSMARRAYARDYGSIEHLTVVLGSAKIASNKQAKAGWCDIPLNYHYHKTACESALAILSGNWNAAFARVRSLVGRNPRFSDTERYELFYLLKAPALLQEVLTGEIPEALSKKTEFAKNDHRMLCAATAATTLMPTGWQSTTCERGTGTRRSLSGPPRRGSSRYSTRAADWWSKAPPVAQTALREEWAEP